MHRMARGCAQIAAVAALAVAGALAAPDTSAIRADDLTPPVFTKVPTASIPVGASLSDWSCGGPQYTVYPLYMDFRATDAESGIDYYEHYDYESEPNPIRGRYIEASSTMDPGDCFGGGPNITVFGAVNGAGLRTHWWEWDRHRLRVVQDTAAANLTYTGSWAVSDSAESSDGTTHTTTQRGASVELTIETGSQELTPATAALGLVMTTGPQQGRAVVYLDGSWVARVRTYSPTRASRTVVWRKAVSSGVHILRVVNRATRGHPAIDIDAFVTTPKGSTDAGAR